MFNRKEKFSRPCCRSDMSVFVCTMKELGNFLCPFNVLATCMKADISSVVLLKVGDKT